MYLHKNVPFATAYVDYLAVFLQFELPYAMSIFKTIIWELPVIWTSLRYHSPSLQKEERDNEKHQEEMEPK